MSKETIDNLVFEQALYDEPVEKPFLKKDLIFVPDTNPSSTYSTNQITFSTEVLSNNGKYNAFAEGLISIPLVVVARRSAGNGAGLAMSDADYLLAFKNSHVNLIHSMSVDYNSVNVIQPVQYLNSYLTFKQHVEMSSEDEALNGPLLGYAKDSSTSWAFSAADSPQGKGIMNHFNPVLKINYAGPYEGEIANEGMIKRQGYFGKFVDGNGKHLLLNATDNAGRGINATNMIVNESADIKVLYYDCTIRLKDLLFFQNLPPIRSGTVRINLTLNNNVSFNFVKNTAGNLVVSNVQNTTGLTNPLMLAPVCARIRTHANFASDMTDATIATMANVDLPCGSAALPAADGNTYTVAMAIGNCVQNGVTYSHTKQQCRLYVPYYQFSPLAEQKYLQNREKVIDYLDVQYYAFDAKAQGAFNQLITNGVSRMKRLIMIGILTSAANEGISPMSSPFATEPATTSPFMLTNFNVQVGQINLYPNSISFSYEHFLQELNGQQGLNGNLIQGSTSSRISLTDYNNNYKYIVINLDRKLPENEDVAQSLGVSGVLSSLKDITFHCFIEQYKSMVVNVETGARVR